MLVSVASKTRLTPNGGGGGHESSLLLQSILDIVFIVYIMFIMGNRTIYIYIIAEEWLKEKVGVIKPK